MHYFHSTACGRLVHWGRARGSANSGIREKSCHVCNDVNQILVHNHREQRQHHHHHHHHCNQLARWLHSEQGDITQFHTCSFFFLHWWCHRRRPAQVWAPLPYNVVIKPADIHTAFHTSTGWGWYPSTQWRWIRENTIRWFPYLNLLFIAEEGYWFLTYLRRCSGDFR